MSVQNLFPIESDKFESTRLVFVKETIDSHVWHICDMALGGKKYANTIYLTALHGKPVESVVRCYTVAEVKARDLLGTEYFCARCLDEYEIARDIIESRRMLKFS